MKYLRIIPFLLLVFVMNTAVAGPLAKFVKGHSALRSDSGDLHTTYFVGKGTEPVSTLYTLSFGYWVNGVCKPITSVSGSEDIIPNQSGMAICGECLKNYLGDGITCGIEEYTNVITGKSASITYQIISDGKKYTSAIPAEHTVNIY